MTRLRELLLHLATHKRLDLAVLENGIHGSREYAHILPRSHERLNILSRYRESFYSSHYAKIKFHRYFHHLNSSQALCINLFYPLIAENQLRLITQLLEIPATTVPIPTFEKVSELENGQRRTNFDFHLRYAEGQEVYFELKYTERQFGTARDDAEHRDKFAKTYLPLLERSPYLVNACRERAFFLKRYQVLRNLVHLGPHSQVVFVVPSTTFPIATELAESIRHLLNDDGKSHVHIMSLERLIGFITAQTTSPPLVEYFRAFRKKYLPREVFGDAP